MPRLRKPTSAYHHGDLRRALLDAAVSVLEKEGLAALSLNLIAQRAGVSSGAPYHHFESKEALLAAVAEQGFERLTASMRSGAVHAESARAYMEGIGRGYVRFALQHRGHFRAMFRPELREHTGPALKAARDEAFGCLVRGVERCQAEGVIARGDPRPYVLVAWSAVHGASVLWIDGPLRDERLVVDGEALAGAVAGTVARLLAP